MRFWIQGKNPATTTPSEAVTTMTMMSKATAILTLAALHTMHASAFLQTSRAMAPGGHGVVRTRTRWARHGRAHGMCRMAALTPGSSVCVVGSSDVLTQLVIGKLGAKEGWDVSVLTQDDKKAYEANSLMYGRTTARAIRDDGDEGIDSSVKRCVPCVAGVMGDRLETMDALVVVATEKPFDPTVFRNAIIADAAKCSKVVLVSKHGASKAAGGGGGGGGFLAGLLGGGGDTAAMGESENGIRACCEERGIGLSIVRVGALKGGGPGFVENGVAQSDWGLDKHWYDTIFELSQAMSTMAHDRFTVGADGAISKGDTIEQDSNPLTVMAQKEKFEPAVWDTNRAVAGTVVAAMLQREEDDEISVSAAAGKEMVGATEMGAVIEKALS